MNLSGKSQRLRLLGALLWLQMVVALFTFAQNGSLAANGASSFAHKVQVSDPLLAKKIEALGGRLIGDYGSYKLYETGQIPPGLLANTRAELRDGYDVIELHAAHLNTRKAEVRALSQPVGTFSGKQLHLVQFAGPVKTQWRQELLAAGVEIISYIPENTYLVYGDAQSLASVQSLATSSPHYQWHGAYEPNYKIHPLAQNHDAHGRPRSIGTDLFDIQLVDDPQANGATLTLLDQLKLEPFLRRETNRHHISLVVRLNPNVLAQISAQPEVISILPYFPRKRFCERQDQIVAGNLTNGVPAGPGYLAWLTNAGFAQQQFTSSGFVVDVTDSGIDNGTTLPAHFGLYVGGNTTNASRIVYNRYESTVTYGSNTLAGCDGHGNLNAHVIGGYDDFSGFPFADGSGFHYGLGVCPFVNIGSSVIFDSAANDNYYYPNFNNLQAEAYRDGARISCNSWGGANSEGIYDTEAQNYDALVRDAQPTNSSVPVAGNQSMIIVFAAGNDGSATQTIDSPGSAKNVITVGAADNVQPFGGSDRSGVPDDWATNANELPPFSSRGPCADGRAKPDLVAPGTHVSGGVPQATNDFVNYPDGIADSCYNGADVSGGPNSIFWPDSQQFYTASSGTSHSTPCVAGGAALVMQYFLNSFSNAPSPAMAKAYLMNSARYLTGATADDTLPSAGQGMGEMNLGMAFDGEPRVLSDQTPGNLFSESGEMRSFTGHVNDTNHDFRVTLAWTDAPGGTSGNAWNNNLDLAVTIGGNTYKGNVFNGAYSTNGGMADTMNNVESVFIPAGVSGDFLVTVTAADINSVGVPNTNGLPSQDFAVVIYNAVSVPKPILTPAGTTLDYESCEPTNGVIDPGELVTVEFALQNIGTAATTNLVATLLTNSSILSATGPQTFGSLAPDGAPVKAPFTFQAGGACGGTITATLHLQDGPTDLGNVNFNFQLGRFVSAATFAENFDVVTPPNLPAGWSTNFSGVETAWYTTNDNYDTPNNSAFAPDSTNAGETQLISPVISIATSTAQLQFMQDYDLESYPSESSSPSTAYDGGVLEISIGGGAFQDILNAGGSFVTGGYLASVYSPENPLHNRMAWSGNSGGFIQTVVNLPAAATGQNIQLRWSCGTDSGNNNGGSGWHIDSITIFDGYYTCCTPSPVPVLQNPQVIGTNLLFSFHSNPGQSYSIQSTTNLGSGQWNTTQSLNGSGYTITITNDATVPKKFYRIISP